MINKKLTYRNMIQISVTLLITIAVVTAITSIQEIMHRIYKPKPHDLPKQISEVEDAIKNIRNLETYLEKTKSDMIATEEAKVRIEEEYNKVKELEKLTKNQLDAISLAVNKRTKADIVKSYFWGWVLGVSSSLVAGYIIHRITTKRKRKLSKANKIEQ